MLSHRAARERNKEITKGFIWITVHCSRPFRINIIITLAVRERTDATSPFLCQTLSYAAVSRGAVAPSTGQQRTSRPDHLVLLRHNLRRMFFLYRVAQ